MVVPGDGGGRIGQMLFKGTNLQPVVNKPQRSNPQHGEYRQYCRIISKLAETRTIIPTTKKK